MIDQKVISKAVSAALLSVGIMPLANADFKVNNLSINNPKGTTITNSTTTDVFNGGVKLDNSGTFDIINQGTISATSSNNNFALGTYILNNNTTVTNFTNSGTISGTTGGTFGFGIAVSSNATVTNLTNTGTISGEATANSGYGILLTTGTVTNLTNSGTISGTSNENATAVTMGVSTVNNFENSGTLTAHSNDTGTFTVLLSSSTITNLTNSGTISATSDGTGSEGINIASSSTITNLTNTGTISASGTGDVYGIYMSSADTVTNLVNSGTISATSTSGNNVKGIQVHSDGTITNLINSGTISATSKNFAWGVAVGTTSTITTLTNTGTITGSAPGSNKTDVVVFGNANLVNFNNLQTALVYSGRLPTNYSTIIQSDNYGQLQHSTAVVGLSESSTGDTVYTPFAGNTSVPVHIKSKTYSNVLTGIPDANLNDTISGTLFGDGENSIGSVNWQLSNTSGNNWDLITSGGTYTYVGKSNTQTALSNTATNMTNSFKGMSAGGNFANMTTYDCNYFGGKEGCLSVGGRVTESNGTDTKAVLVAGKQVNDNFRFGSYIDQTLAHHGYNDIDINPKIPLVGLMGVWNKSKDKKGLQVKLANSYQKNEATITRSAVGTSELAKGTTDIETQSYVVEGSYLIKSLSDKEIRPFTAVRYMKTKQEGYREKNVNAPMVYSKAVEESTDILSGIKANYKINDTFTFNYALGLEHSLNDNNAQLVGDIAGISDFKPVSVGGEKKKTRKFASIGFYKLLDTKVRLEGKVMHQELRYKNSKDATTAYVTYTLPF